VLGVSYLYAIRIKTISDSKYSLSNLSTGFVKFAIQNKYDGMYETKGYFIHPSLGKSTFDWSGPDGEPLQTIGATSVQMPWAGDRAIAVNLNVTTEMMTLPNGHEVNKVQVSIPSYPGAFGQTAIDDLGNTMNYYDPATKTFELFYWYNNAAHRIIRETLIYEGPR
jgi:hypothetical protein